MYCTHAHIYKAEIPSLGYLHFFIIFGKITIKSTRTIVYILCASFQWRHGTHVFFWEGGKGSTFPTNRKFFPTNQNFLTTTDFKSSPPPPSTTLTISDNLDTPLAAPATAPLPRSVYRTECQSSCDPSISTKFKLNY
jgi:hypothetical protein